MNFDRQIYKSNNYYAPAQADSEKGFTTSDNIFLNIATKKKKKCVAEEIMLPSIEGVSETVRLDLF